MSSILDSVDTGLKELDEHLTHVRNFDWSSTSVGPISSWPQDLLQLVHVMMLDPQPRVICLGDESWMLYNPAYAKIIACDKHPKALGRTLAVASGALYNSFLHSSRNRKNGQKLGYIAVENNHITLERNGFMEDRVFNWDMIPLASSLTGTYVSVTDVTEVHLA